MAGTSKEIQITLSKNNHIPEHGIWWEQYTNCFHVHILQSSQQLYKKGTEYPFFRKQRLWREDGGHEIAWPGSKNNTAWIQTQVFRLLVSVFFHCAGCSHGNPIKLPKQWWAGGKENQDQERRAPTPQPSLLHSASWSKAVSHQTALSLLQHLFDNTPAL